MPIGLGYAPLSTFVFGKGEQPLWLWIMHAAAAVLHFMSLFAVRMIARDVPDIPVYRVRPMYNETSGFVPLPESLHAQVGAHVVAWSLPVTFFTLSFAEELIYVVFGAWYWTMLVKPKFVWTRWLFYFFSAPTMIWLFGYSTGIIVAMPLCTLSCLIAVCISTGAGYERTGRQHAEFLVIGFLAVFLAFVFVWSQYSHCPACPDWVLALVVLMSILFMSFGGVPILQWVCVVKGWDEDVIGEACYTFLSISAKMILGWVFAYGIVARSG